MTNDGEGIDVVIHPETSLWVPEMIFGHLRTSTNYNKEENKIVGGKNGFGVKLVYVWSVYGTVETVDHKTLQKYEQRFSNNLEIIHPPKITKVRPGTKPYTKISFLPDYARLGIEGLSQDMLDLFKKRTMDLSAITHSKMKVKWNNELLKVKTFRDYADLYLGDKTTVPRIHEVIDDHWEYIVAISPTSEFAHVSFVNGIYTSKGGKHVEYILNQIIKKMVALIETKKKITVSPSNIKEQLMLFLRCNIVNPSFDSQTKDFMNTAPSKFGSTCTVSNTFIDKLAKLGIMETACSVAQVREHNILKKQDGAKIKTIRDIPKLLDAGYAGTSKSANCMLIICEGDSAKAGITSGLSMADRHWIGVYPLKGKILNVRGELPKRISDNKEIHEIKRVLGLEIGRVYETTEDVNKHLRYSKVVFMTDQDLDGSHIKGLCINLFHSEWSSLLKIPNFIGFLNTPILKASKGKETVEFYNRGEYDLWKQVHLANIHLWHIKYYKGLGTSTDGEFREYLKDRNIIHFIHDGEPSDNIVDMVFNKKRADDRKSWLETYNRDEYLNTSTPNISYSEFVHKELIHFSKYDCDRSIPNLMDGLKRSLRKILFSSFKKKLTTDIKVAQFSGYVSEHSGYHHGEASINAAIIGMAQDFVGSNNINLLVPNGQFGSRLLGGKDSASERYIYTRLNTITRRIFPESDDPVLNYLEDDGLSIEPLYYIPIIPMILVNGAKGIGTGFSTTIPCYNPSTIITYLIEKLTTGSSTLTNSDFIPYYEGFTGTITQGETPDRFIISGKYEIIGEDRICITELPIGTWTEDYKEFLDGLAQSGVDKTGKKTASVIKDYEDLYTKTKVNFPITLHDKQLATLTHSQIMTKFKLTTTINTSNMHLFDAEDKLKKYNTVCEIIDEYYTHRLNLYTDRKKHIMNIYANQLLVLTNKERYISALLTGEIDLRGKKQNVIVELLEMHEYQKITSSYDYLLKMPMDSVSDENMDKLSKERIKISTELEKISNTPESEMWHNDLVCLDAEYKTYINNRNSSSSTKEVIPTKSVKKTRIIQKKIVV
jgi:DNA topoisomerase-2